MAGRESYSALVSGNAASGTRRRGAAQRGERRQEILQALARELETSPGARITTARLAEVLGVSEAALYRHFPSKARMFEGLFDFAEDTVFTRMNRALEEAPEALDGCGQALAVILAFANRNPGITRVLLADALVGEHGRLRERAHQFFERIETMLRLALARAELEPGRPRAALRSGPSAALMVALVEGRLHRYGRGGFREPPDAGWAEEWALLCAALRPQNRPATSAMHD